MERARPDGGITPFAHEKNTNWEGAWRVPAFVRWPGKFRAGTVLNGIVTHQDWAETLPAGNIAEHADIGMAGRWKITSLAPGG